MNKLWRSFLSLYSFINFYLFAFSCFFFFFFFFFFSVFFSFSFSYKNAGAVQSDWVAFLSKAIHKGKFMTELKAFSIEEASQVHQQRQFLPSGHTTLKWRRINVDATSFWCCVPAGSYLLLLVLGSLCFVIVAFHWYLLPILLSDAASPFLKSPPWQYSAPAKHPESVGFYGLEQCCSSFCAPNFKEVEGGGGGGWGGRGVILVLGLSVRPSVCQSARSVTLAYGQERLGMVTARILHIASAWKISGPVYFFVLPSGFSLRSYSPFIDFSIWQQTVGTSYAQLLIEFYTDQFETF